MAIGFVDLNGTQRIPDKGLTVNNQPNVLVAKFGDGYEQRVENGINSLNQALNVNFQDREKAEADAITSFFESKAGVESFELTIPYGGDGTPGTESTTERIIKVVCGSWSTVYSYDDFYTVNASFRRVYEA